MINFLVYKWKTLNITYLLHCVDSFILMDLKQLKAIQYIMKLELKRDYCNGAGYLLIFCTQVNEKKIAVEDINKITLERIINLGQNILLTFWVEDLRCHTDEENKN